MDDPKAIEAGVKALESSLGSVGTKLAVATACVVLGLLIEYWDDARNAFKAIGRCIWYRRWSDWATLDRHLKAAFIGGIFITCGVAAELWYEHRANVLEGQLQTENGNLIAILNAEEATLDNSTQHLKTEAETQRGIAAGALQKAGEANATAEKERLERVKLEALVSPRLLTIDQQRQIGSACAGLYKYGPRRRITLHAYGLDVEARTLLLEIQSAFASSQLYTYREEGGVISSGEFDTGIFISAPPEDIDFANCLQKALSEIGRLKRVSVNAPRHGGTAFSGGVTTSGSMSMQGGGPDVQIHPSPGSPLDIFVGVRPSEVTAFSP